MNDYFPTMSMKPNPQCDSKHCVKRQREHEEYLRAHPTVSEVLEEQRPVVVHESNEWGKVNSFTAYDECFRAGPIMF